MTIQELYDLIGGNYAQAQRVMRMDKLIDRYIRKFVGSNLGEALQAAGETLEPSAMFESAHAMKGVCANLGLDELSNLASVLADEFRPGRERQLTDEQVWAKLAETDRLYRTTMEGISRYING